MHILTDGNNTVSFKTKKIAEKYKNHAKRMGIQVYYTNKTLEKNNMNFELDGESLELVNCCKSDLSLAIPDKIFGLAVTSIRHMALNDCMNLREIIIPPSVTCIKHYAFRYCINLEKITIPSSVTHIGDFAFDHCYKLANIIVDPQNPNYTSIDGVLFDKEEKNIIAYSSNKKAKTYIIPSSVTAFDDSAFDGCKNLTELTIPASVFALGSPAFWKGNNLQKIILSRRIMHFDDIPKEKIIYSD
ncbi:MAG: leucine-rich repeat domain-containing protein [Spirochaetaceae bacterium]|nr:leucine-rich repeat domain-containing protein [Spirochaetaceae bacterium]